MITDKTSCNIIAEVLAAHGIREAVVSPGSRNAPLILAFDDRPEMNLTVVADERSAAFIALGMAQAGRRPVALVCTSGSALLNYAPAVSEAYYQGIPLIVVSADRPTQWIDQDDSQTIRQFEALGNFVKRSFDIPDCLMPGDEHLWYANRIANDACLAAVSGKPGPVHINVQLHAPLTRKGSSAPMQRIVSAVGGEDIISRETAQKLAEEAAGKSILVVAGFMPPDYRLSKTMAAFSRIPGVYLLHETLANLHSCDGCQAVDTVVGFLDDDDKERLRPDIVITFGGALVSRFIKQYLRDYPPRYGHWSVGPGDTVVDCFKSLSLRITTSPAGFFRRFGGALKAKAGGNHRYTELWQTAAQRATESHRRYLTDIPWSDMKALKMVFDRLPSDTNLQLSNGTPVRYAQLLQSRPPHAVFCNRGVSGIDGCTSTATGAAMAYGGLTLLISGDLSFSYDISALACRSIPPTMRIIVMNNSGGAIFRFVATTASLPEEKRERYFCADPAIDTNGVAAAFGFIYECADSPESMSKALDRLFSKSERPVILEAKTPPEVSAEILRKYFDRR